MSPYCLGFVNTPKLTSVTISRTPIWASRKSATTSVFPTSPSLVNSAVVPLACHLQTSGRRWRSNRQSSKSQFVTNQAISWLSALWHDWWWCLCPCKLRILFHEEVGTLSRQFRNVFPNGRESFHDSLGKGVKMNAMSCLIYVNQQSIIHIIHTVS